LVKCVELGKKRGVQQKYLFELCQAVSDKGMGKRFPAPAKTNEGSARVLKTAKHEKQDREGRPRTSPRDGKREKTGVETSQPRKGARRKKGGCRKVSRIQARVNDTGTGKGNKNPDKDEHLWWQEKKKRD